MPWKLMEKPDPFDIALYGLVITAIIAAIYGFQLKAMRDQLDLMDKQFTISHRPWVGLVNVAGVTEPLTFDSDGAHIHATFAMKNGGSSPALEVHPTALLVIATDRTMLSDVNSVIQEWCSPSIVGQTVKMKVGTPLLLPGETTDIQNPTRAFMRRKDFRVEPTDHLAEAWIVFSIIYEDDLGKPHCSAIAQAYRAEDGRYQFEPNGIIKGSFTPTGFGQAY